MQRLNDFAQRHPGLLAFIYIGAVPVAILALASVATYNLSKNRRQDRQQAAAIALNRKAIALNHQAIVLNRRAIQADCARAYAILTFLGSAIPANQPSAVYVRQLYLRLIDAYDAAGNCPHFLPPQPKKRR